MSRHPVLSSLLTLALVADTAMCVHIAWHSQTLAVWLTAAALAYGSMLAVVWSLASVWYSVRNAAVRRARRRRYTPDGRSQPGVGNRPVAPVEGRHARAMAAVAAQPTHDGHTVQMPAITVAAAQSWEYSGGSR